MKDKKEHRRRVVKRRTRPQTAPGRLGWLGGGLASSSATTSMGNDNHNNVHIDDGSNHNNDVNNAGSQSCYSGEKLLTPRPDCDIHNATSTITDGDADIDLTEDNSKNNMQLDMSKMYTH